MTTFEYRGLSPDGVKVSGVIHAYNEYDGSGNGFSFANYNAHEMMATVRYAESIFADRKRWNALVRRVMGVDFSWSSSARQYVQLYESML